MKQALIKKRISVWGNGLIGTGMFGQGVPSFIQLLNRLAENYEVTFYNFKAISSYDPSWKFNIVSTPPWKFRIRFIILVIRFILNHLDRRQHILYVMGALPSGPAAVLLGRIFSIPVVVNYYFAELARLPEIKFGDLLDKKKFRITRQVTKKANAVIILSNFQKEKIRSELGIDRYVDVIYRGLDTGKTVPPVDRRLNMPIQFIHVAHLMPLKDQETLLKAFQIIASQFNSVLKIFGIDDMQGSVHKLAGELGLSSNVIISNPVPHEQLIRHYQEADIMLHTSRYENQPQAVMEAMMYGVAVCGTSVGFLKDLSGSCVLTVDPRDYRSLASNAIHLINNPQRFNELRANSYDWVCAHSLSWTVDKYADVFERVSRQ